MNILITCNTMSYLSGSPLYNYTLAIELAKQGHTVTLLSRFEDWVELDDQRHILKSNLINAGVNCVDIKKPNTAIQSYDYAFISQKTGIEFVQRMNPRRIVNIIHSEYDCEQPCVANVYVAIRPTIKDRLVKQFGIPEQLIKVIYNGVDRERFAPRTLQINYRVRKIVVPCTLDPLREKFLNYIISEARLNPNDKIEIYGKDCGARLDPLPSNVTIHPPTFYIEDAMKDACLVSGILLGRVNLEARSMGIVNTVHDPNDPESFYHFYPNEEEFDKKHNIHNVAKELIQC